jgi:hypothetical protein
MLKNPEKLNNKMEDMLKMEENLSNKTCQWCKYVNPINGKCIILGKKVPKSATGCPVKEKKDEQ